jgi:DNA-binding FrmR family transcriptional regulator
MAGRGSICGHGVAAGGNKDCPQTFAGDQPTAATEREERVLREKVKIIHRVRRILGQVDAIERTLEQEVSCSLRLIASVRGAVNGLMAELLECHIRTRVVDPGHESDAARAGAGEELIDVVRSYLR